MSYYLAPSLAKLRAQVNAMFPTRDKESDGWIGDAAHNARKSDHNADWSSIPKGIVRAFDFDEDLWGRNVRDPGPIAQALADAFTRDSRTAYVIYEGRIWQNPAVFKNGGWRKYSGVNAHKKHVHISLRHGITWERNEAAWPMPSAPGTPATPPGGTNRPASAQQLEMLQFLGHSSVVAYQKAHALHPDGDMGPITSDALKREYDMTVQQINQRLDGIQRLLENLNGNRIHEVVSNELNVKKGPGRPDSISVEVGHAKTKLERLDLREVLFSLADGTQSIHWVGTGTWARIPNDDVARRHGGVNDHLKFSNTLAIRTWASITGGNGVVQEPLAFGREVEWARLPEVLPALNDEDVAVATIDGESDK